MALMDTPRQAIPIPISVAQSLAAVCATLIFLVGPNSAEEPAPPAPLLPAALPAEPLSPEEAAMIKALRQGRGVGINSTGAAKVQLQHNGRPESQAFPESRWIIQAAEGFQGATVLFSCGPFLHSQQQELEVDSQLALRVLQSSRRAEWRVAAASDRTDVRRHDRRATVTAVSRNSGSAQLGLTVGFLDQGGELLEGDYVITVVGTITSN
jgi:hypothetical protein